MKLILSFAGLLLSLPVWTFGSVACDLEVTVTSSTSPTCYNSLDGTLFMGSANATGQVTFSINGGASQTNPLNGLSSGSLEIIATDAAGCQDTINYFLAGPDSIYVSATSTLTTCYNDCDGTALAIGSGGSGTLSYIWGTVPATFNQSATGLCAGTYNVTVSDGMGCKRVTSVDVHEPDELILMMSQDSVFCYGDSTGVAIASPSGGIGPYEYSWQNGLISSSISGLIAGNYEVTVIDSKMCKASGSIEVFQPDPFTIQLNSIASSCVNSPDGQATATAITGGSAPFVLSWSNNQGYSALGVSVSDLLPGLYFCNATDAKGCSVSDSIIVMPPDSMVISVTGTIVPSCHNSDNGSLTVDATLGAGGYSYTWDAAAGNQTGATASNLTASNYIVSVMDANGCIQTLKVELSAPDEIAIDFLFTPPSCPNKQDGSIEVLATGGNGGFTYKWDFLANPSPSIVSNLQAGDYCLKVMDANGCAKDTCITFSDPNAIQSNGFNINNISCFGSSDGSLKIMATGGTGNLGYLWNDPLSQSTDSSTNLSAGIYFVTITDASGCSIVDSAEVIEPPAMELTFDLTPVSCKGGFNGMLDLAVLNNQGNYTILWEDGQDESPAVDLQAGFFSVTVTDENSCMAIDSFEVTEPQEALLLTIVQDLQGCFGENANAATAMATGGGGAYEYTWSNDVGIGAQKSGLLPISYTVEVMDDNGCTVSKDIQLEDLPEIIPNVFPTEPLCNEGLNGTLAEMDLDPSTHTFSWLGMNNSMNPLLENIGSGEYTLIVTNNANCKDTSIWLLGEPDPMMANIEVEPVQCFGFKNGSLAILSTSGPGVITTNWVVDGAVISASSIQELSVGTYLLQFSNELGCQADSLVKVESPKPITPSFDVENNKCPGDQAGAVTVSAEGGNGNYTYTWEDGANGQHISNLDVGWYPVTIRDEKGCEKLDSAEVTSIAPMYIDPIVTGIECFGDKNGVIEIEVSGGTGPFQYKLEGEDYIDNSVLLGLEAGSYQLSVLDANGCVKSFQAEIPAVAETSVSAGDEIQIGLGDSVPLILEMENVMGDYEVIWLTPPNHSLSCFGQDTLLNCEEPIASPDFTTTYEVEIIDERGCVAKDRVTVTVGKTREVFIPTGFTPNGDFSNDRLNIFSKQELVVNSFSVYDRRGQMVFFEKNLPINDLLVGWDGTFRGKTQPAGIYIWTIEVTFADGYQETYGGEVNLIR